MTNGKDLVEVSALLRDDGARRTRMLVAVSDDVLFNERLFKDAARAMLERSIQTACDQFMEDHQAWIRDVFNVQSLRIALFDELQRRVEALADAVDVASDIDAPPEIRELITP